MRWRLQDRIAIYEDVEFEIIVRQIAVGSSEHPTLAPAVAAPEDHRFEFFRWNDFLDLGGDVLAKLLKFRFQFFIAVHREATGVLGTKGVVRSEQTGSNLWIATI